jgi:putative transposase
MSIRRVPFTFGEYFHVYNRGNSKQDIFKDNLDRERFQMLLFLANGTAPFVFREVEKDGVYDFERGNQLVHIGVYCLMPNHFHILLTPAVEGGVQTFMQKLLTGYSMYFNRKYERTGVLFEGKFKAQHADSDEYLKYLFSYIHLNPLKLVDSEWKEKGLKNLQGGERHLNDYRFSSYLDFREGERTESAILDTSAFPKYFPTEDSFMKEIQEWMKYRSLAEVRP